MDSYCRSIWPATRPSLQRTLSITFVLLAVASAVLCASLAVADGFAKESFQPYREKLPGSTVSFQMVPIKGGTFRMGAPPGEKGRANDEEPVHPVRVSSFWIGKTEVTWDEYDQYWKSTGLPPGGTPAATKPAGADAITRPTPPYADETFGHGREGYPVIAITHHAAMEYCRWLSTKTGRVYRLPTEAEWEYACRAGTQAAYYFGDDASRLNEFAWYAANSDETTHPVGSKKPNPWGLHDMLGNVAEWCLDEYRADYYQSFPLDKATLNPVLLPGPNRFPHVTRGGAWTDSPERLRCAARRKSDPSWIRRDPQRPQSIWWLTDAEFVGFRLVRPGPDPAMIQGVRSRVTTESK